MTKSTFSSIQRMFASLFLLTFFAIQTANAQSTDPIAQLKSGKQLICIPEETVFCSNVHVNCAGRTKIPTFTFKLQMKSNALAITVPPDFKEFTENYQSSKLEWDEQAKFLVIAPSDNKGYIKLTDDGRYVFRHYPRQQEGVMSIGKCEQ
jgi:hypothetical protein